MRHLALLLGLVLVFASLPSAHRAAGGAVGSEVFPAGALLLPAEGSARAGHRAEAEPTDKASDATTGRIAQAVPKLSSKLSHRADDAFTSDWRTTLFPNPARAPPGFS